MLSSWFVSTLQDALLALVYVGVVPDSLVRAGIRALLARMKAEQDARGPAARLAYTLAYVSDLKTRALAEHTAAANEQHYEVPAAFYAHVMGRFRKYSCGAWPRGAGMTLDESEEAALALVCERAELGSLAPGSAPLCGSAETLAAAP